MTDIHSRYNDCILEWKLFEKLETECVFFIVEHLFRYTPDYIIPFSYLFKHPSLAKAANVKIPTFQGKATEAVANKEEVKSLFPNCYGAPAVKFNASST